MSASGEPRVFEFGDYRLDTGRHALCHVPDGRWMPLTPRVFDTLLFMVERPGVLLDKSSLMNAVWPNLVVEENNLDQNVSTLRQLLGERRGEHRYIVTVRGRGYRFAAPVTEVPAAEAPGAAAGASAAAGDDSGSVAAPPPGRRRGQAAVLAGLAAAAVAAAFFWSSAGEREVTFAPPGSRALAVLPFRPLVAADRNESLELGMAETLIRGLNGTDLMVRPLSAVRRYADPGQDAVLAGRDLGVDAVLEGHLQRDGARLRVTARLLNVEDGRQLWADRYDESFTDVFAVQDSIAAKVRAALAPDPLDSPQPMLQIYTGDAEAYELYLRGRFYRQQGSEAGLRQALAHFQQAIDLDPGFALAWVGLSEVRAILGVFGIVAPHDTYPQARQAVERALKLAPELGEAYASLGHIKVQYEHDWEGAEAAYRRAIELNPYYPPAQQMLGIYLALSGNFEEGLARMRHAQELEPAAPLYSALVGMLLNYERRYTEAIDQLEKTLEMAPDLPTAHTYLAVSYLRLGDYERAAHHLERSSSLTPGSAAYRGQILALSGRRGEAYDEIQRLIGESEQRYVAAYDIATIYGVLGDVDETFLWLERAFKDRSQLIGWVLRDPAFDGIRADPRYRSIVRKLNLPSQES